MIYLNIGPAHNMRCMMRAEVDKFKFSFSNQAFAGLTVLYSEIRPNAKRRTGM